jgi:outer membrane usher protein
MGLGGAALAQPGVPSQSQNRTITIGAPPPVAAAVAPQRLNPTGRPITLTVPAKDGALYLGDIVVVISADDKVEFSSQRVLDLLSNIVTPSSLETMRGALAGKNMANAQDFMPAGLLITYNPQTLELKLDIPSQLRAAQGLSVASLDRARFGDFAQPAGFSSYLNIRGNVDYRHTGINTGFGDPVFFLDTATRLNKVVLESQGVWTPGGASGEFQRQGSRAVYDDPKNIVRWTLGDLQPVVRGYQSAPSMAGVSVFRSYSTLAPQSIARPRGDRSFTLERPSTVEVYINGQVLRRVQLTAGNYNLSDFPFTQGANDVRLSITDDTGRTEVLRFNVFIDQTQLGKGLAEFGLFTGTKSSLDSNGPNYSSGWTATGFYRRGVSDNLTLGGSVQADQHRSLVGVEALQGTSFGTVAVQLAMSDIDGFKTGRATTITFQRLFQNAGGQADSLNLSYQSRSETFGPAGTVTPSNPFKYEVGAGYTHAFGNGFYTGVDLHYSNGRGTTPDFSNYRATAGWRLTPTTSLTADVLYENGLNGKNLAGLISLTKRLGPYSSVHGDYDSRGNRARVGYQTLHGNGVGSFAASADLEHSDTSSGVYGVVNYVGNRGEVGLTHLSTFDSGFSNVQDERTSFRFGTSLAVADGAFAIGRPIFDSFVVVKPHAILKGANVVLYPTPFGYIAETGVLGAAVAPNLPSYSEQTITVDAPEAPSGVDLGQGSFRVFPPYRSGYRLQVGSDYYVTAVGSLMDTAGQPLSLIAGTATEVANPTREPLTLFTNREGRFGLAGLKPGQWRIEMLGDEPATYLINVPADATFVLRLQNLKPVEGKSP